MGETCLVCAVQLASLLWLLDNVSVVVVVALGGQIATLKLLPVTCASEVSGAVGLHHNPPLGRMATPMVGRIGGGL